LKLIIHQGIEIHLRDGIPAPEYNNYKTFVSENVKGKVVDFKGIILVSRDYDIIKEKLKSVYIKYMDPSKPGVNCFETEEGIIIIGPLNKEIPRKFKPRIEEDKENKF